MRGHRSHAPTSSRALTRQARGFTLIEVLVALAAMALMAALGWRGIDGLLRGRQSSQARVDQMAVMHTALAQWQSDLDNVFPLPGNAGLPGLDWNGRVLRVLRRATVPDAQGGDAGLWVVSWTIRLPSPEEADRLGLSGPALQPCWVRTQSPATTERRVLQLYWAEAAQGVPSGSPVSTAVLFPASRWQLFYYRGDAWSNPLSSAGVVGATQESPLPDGVRLQLSLPEGAQPGGTLTLDWVQPAYSVPRS